MDEEKKQRVAAFRYGIIADFVGGVHLDYGDKERLLKEKTSRLYEIPFSRRRTLSKPTIISWVRRYKAAGNRIEGLYPKSRRDMGSFRSLEPSLRMAIKQVLADEPRLTVPSLIRRLKQKGFIPSEAEINPATVYRFIEKEGLRKQAKNDGEDRRRFEAQASNDLWQSDVLHGPRAWIDGQKRKTYLIGIMDDHSRMIVSGRFYPAENLDCFADCLYQGVSRWGLPQKLYVDNGACYRAHQLEFVSAALGIGLIHARPYKPQGKGKIERFFRTVRQDFLERSPKTLKLDELNEVFEQWLVEYHDKEHSTTAQSPLHRFRKGMSCLRPAPADLLQYFRLVERRLVRKDRCVHLHSKIFEVPTALIDKRVELRFHRDEPDDVEIFYENRSFGKATLVDQKINASIARDWYKPKPLKPEEASSPPPVHGGSLFDGGSTRE